MPTPNKFVELQRLVKKLSGHAGFALTTDESKAAKEKSPEAYAEYLTARREYNTAWRTIIKRVCGTKLKPYATVVQTLAKEGFTQVLPDGFVGLLDGDCNFYTVDGEAIEGKPTVTNFPKIRMNPDHHDSDSNFVFIGIRPDGKRGPHFYTKEYKKQQHEEKFSKVAVLDLPAIRKRWLPFVKGFTTNEPKCVAATVLEMLFQFTARIGSPGNSTYGIATLRCRHVKASSQGLVITYLGKDEVRTVHKLVLSNVEHKPLVKNITALLANKEPKDLLFTVDRGNKLIRMTPTYVNKLWKALGGGNTTVHKIRTYTATKLFQSLMEKAFASDATRPKTQKEANELFKAVAVEVGSALNHVKRTKDGQKITGATALKSYIDSDLQVLYFHNLGMPLPTYLQKYSQQL